MKNYRESLNEKLKNPEFKKEWDALEEEYELEKQRIRAEIAAQQKNQITSDEFQINQAS